MRDLVHDLQMLQAIDPAVYDATPTPITIDRLGFDSLMFCVSIGVGGITFTATNRIDFIMQHSDDNATWIPVLADNVLNATPDVNGVVYSLQTAEPIPSAFKVGYIGGAVGQKRYVRIYPSFQGTQTTGTAIDALAIQGEPLSSPVA